MTLSEVFDNARPEPICQGERHATPNVHEISILWVKRVVIRYTIGFVKLILIAERGRLEAPVLLESVRTGADLAASVIEYAASAFACVPHELPST